jgi:hypothetical protein
MFERGERANMALAVRSLLVLMALAALQAEVVPAVAQAPATPPVPASPAAPAPPAISLTALKQLEPGLWQLDIKGRAAKQSCVAETTALLQIEHDQPNCTRFVIANEAKSATVHYSCQRAGWGRTTVRVETAGLASIQTQGISKNQPFDYSVQARRLGTCGAQAALKQR